MKKDILYSSSPTLSEVGVIEHSVLGFVFDIVGYLWTYCTP